MSENSPETIRPVETTVSMGDIDLQEEININLSHEQRRRRRRRRHVSRRLRHEKTIQRFGTGHIILGVICVTLQMVHFTNNSIFSESQPGLWSGTFFVITGSVCVGLAKTSGFYSMVAMLSFCLVSLLMALTLSSLSWLGVEAAAFCEMIENDCIAATPGTNITDTSTSGPLPPITSSVARYYITFTEDLSGLTCDDLSNFVCGFNISLARSLHSVLVLIGVVGATFSFILATLACSRPPERHSRHPRHSIFAISATDGEQPTSVRPITPWEFPPPTKDPLPPTSSLYPDDPPPPYEEDTIVDSSYM